MCNLYQATPKDDLEVFIRKHLNDLHLPDFDALRPVGPFGTGLFLQPNGQGLRGTLAQWGMIRPKSPPPRPGEKRYNTNNARLESIADKPTYRNAWKTGQRCLIPATWYAEPNWETGKNIWWHLKRADGQPWFIAGLWDEWTNPETGEIIPNFTMVTRNCDDHTMLSRLHKPDRKLPANQQDKRSLVHIDPSDWRQWLTGNELEASALLTLQPASVFDQSDALKTDALLAATGSSGQLF